MWSSYTSKNTGELVGLADSTLRACVRSGVLAIDPEEFPIRFGFQDLVVLKQVKSLLAQGVPARRLYSELSQVRRARQNGDLAGLALSSLSGHVVVQEGDVTWRADNGQLLLPWAELERKPAAPVQSKDAALTPFPVARRLPKIEPAVEMTAAEWAQRGTELEDSDPEAAIDAYRRALSLEPNDVRTMINVGRLHAEAGASDVAYEIFERAIAVDPNDATAWYNLGVVSQDLGNDSEAVKLYLQALALDTTLAEAHYNLATLFDRGGDTRMAIRHINEYRKLTRVKKS